MTRIGTRIGLPLGFALVALAPLGAMAEDQAVIAQISSFKFAPAPPAHVTLSGGATPDAKLDISAPQDSERSGFEILWRETTDPRWSVFQVMATPGQTVLSGVSTDNHFFAVRAVGKNGARSLAVPAAEAVPTP